MSIFNFFREEKMQTTPDKVLNNEVGQVHSQFTYPRFNRRLAVSAYNGLWGSAIDYNCNAAANGILRLYSKTSYNGQKCLYTTYKHPSYYQRNYLKGKLEDKPVQEFISKNIEDNYEIVQDHPISDLFMRANPMQSTYQLFLNIYLQLEITGDAYVHVVSFEDGTPSQLYVLQSQYIEIVSGKPGSGQLVDSYVYKRNQATPVSYPPDEIIHIKYVDPDSIWYGKGKIEKGWASHILNKYSHEYLTALYANMAVPDYLLVNKSGNSINKKRFFHKMQSLMRGSKNRGKVMAVDGDVDIKSVAFKPKDMSDVKFTIQEIAAVSGCPLNKLIGNDNIKANSEEQNSNWLSCTIHPMMKLVASGLTEGLLWRYGIEDGTAYLMYDSPVPEDYEQQRKTNDTYLKNAVMTPNEVRISLGLDPIEDETLDIVYFNGNKLGENNNNPTGSNPFVEEVDEVEEDEVEEEEVVEDDDKSIIDNEIKDKLDGIIKDITEINKKEPVQPININIENSSNVEEEVIIEEEEKEIEKEIIE